MQLFAEKQPLPVPGADLRLWPGLDWQPAADTCLDARCNGVGQKFANLGYNIVVTRINLHGARFTLHVHQNDGDAVFYGYRSHAVIQPHGGYVVDNSGAGVQRRFRDRCLGCVDGDGDVDMFGKPLNNRYDAIHLFFDRDSIGKWPGGLTTDIDDIGSRIGQPPGLRQRRLSRAKLSAVGE